MTRLAAFRLAACLAAVSALAGPAWAQDNSSQRSRRSQRVLMPERQVSSPDGRVKFTVLPNAERLTFTVTMDATTVVEPSPLVMSLDGFDLSSGVVGGAAERYELNETYPWHGAHSTATNHCHGVRLALQHDLSGLDYALEVRAFDDGVAYRHIIPGEAGALRTPDEHSSFIVPEGSTVYYAGLQGGHYEGAYEKKAAADVQPGEWSGPPLTLQLPGGAGYAAITEANLVNYSGMALEADGRRGWITGLGHRQPLNWPFELRYGRDEGKRLGHAAVIAGTITTPWRVVLLGRDLNTLVNSTMLPNLCPPPDTNLFPQGIRTGWIRPGRAVWRYVDGGPEGVEGMKAFSRQAGELGFEYHVMEGFWRNWTTAEREEVADHAKQRGVGLLYWKHSRDLRTPEQREEFFSLLRRLGVAGAKIDFFDHEHKDLVDLYEALLRKAAEYQLVCVFHGANKPTGRERTWPNEMVREAVKGMEASRLPDRARHQATLPFTRYIAGGADYTTMIFNARRGDTTIANQIASEVILNSPFQTIAANPQTLLTHLAVDVIKSIPSVWDETVVLPSSEIGDLAVFARRRGDTWFLAVMNGPTARTVRVPLAFLGAGSQHTSIVRDGSEPSAAIVEQATAKRDDTLEIKVGAGGGYVARFLKP